MSRDIDLDNAVGQELPELTRVSPLEFCEALKKIKSGSGGPDFFEYYKYAITVRVTVSGGHREVTPEILEVERAAFSSDTSPADREFTLSVLYVYYNGVIVQVCRTARVPRHMWDEIISDVWADVLAVEVAPLRLVGYIRVIAQRKVWGLALDEMASQEVPVTNLGLGNSDEQEYLDIEVLEEIDSGDSPWSAACTVTPEDIVTAADLRNYLTNLGLARVGPEKWAVFLAVSNDGQDPWRVAKEFGRTVRYITDSVAEVRTVLKDELTKANLWKYKP